jgi:hypothetical protein
MLIVKKKIEILKHENPEDGISVGEINYKNITLSLTRSSSELNFEHKS